MNEIALKSLPPWVYFVSNCVSSPISSDGWIMVLVAAGMGPAWAIAVFSLSLHSLIVAFFTKF